jgi:hypothetical protein
MRPPGGLRSHASLLTLESSIRITIRAGNAAETATLVERYTTNYLVRGSPGKAAFVLANPRGLSRLRSIRSRGSSPQRSPFRAWP